MYEFPNVDEYYVQVSGININVSQKNLRVILINSFFFMLYSIKERMIMVQNISEENETFLHIMLFPDIIQFITPYIGNINYWFDIIVSNY